LNEIGRASGTNMQVTGRGSIMTVHFTGGEIRSTGDLAGADPDDKALFHLELLARGQYLSRRGYISLSLALNDADLDAFAGAVGEVLAAHGPVLGRRG
jgi:glutamate-1-semialdehyde 2,1-aminomutase